jgi:hypothetical protein
MFLKDTAQYSCKTLSKKRDLCGVIAESDSQTSLVLRDNCLATGGVEALTRSLLLPPLSLSSTTVAPALAVPGSATATATVTMASTLEHVDVEDNFVSADAVRSLEAALLARQQFHDRP